MDHACGGLAHSAGLRWLEDGKYPLDCNGPTSRVFTRFCDEDLNRPIIEHFERVARRHPTRIAVTDSDTALSYAELWAGLSGLAETIAVEKVVRVCRHRFWTSKRECYVDRSRPPTVCHHLRNSSRRDCY